MLLALPGMTQAGLDSVLQELSTIRSEKKAANRVKEMLVAAAGGGDALRALAARASTYCPSCHRDTDHDVKRHPILTLVY